MTRTSGGRRILIVDNEPLMRDFLKEFLHRKGFEVKAVEDGSEAFFLIRGEKYALVFADSRTTTTDLPPGN